jgi:hypothetical protein
MVDPSETELPMAYMFYTIYLDPINSMVAYIHTGEHVMTKGKQSQAKAVQNFKKRCKTAYLNCRLAEEPRDCRGGGRGRTAAAALGCAAASPGS